MPEEQFERLLERLVERLEEKFQPPKRTPLSHLWEWSTVIVMAVSVIYGYGRLSQRQDNMDLVIAELKAQKADKDVLTVELKAQNDQLKGIHEELVEIKRLSYPPSFTAWSAGTKLRVKKH